ncbi:MULTISPECIES: mycothiol synthase [unclassified Corynebacterium]|uniref:mycothiol synthase n=1 Tax=unclassified Corynebacterium TaxID=2624378 RepID=UPI0008A13653|nr:MULTISPECIES: mycothiol synthase [unclassified Corynebacterium]OFN78117.1 mycothiol synthase [Corynebacterium sp. HMSC074E01]OHO64030.1 mycothiol synthase [Corynebacterium sp. HMSC036D02]
MNVETITVPQNLDLAQRVEELAAAAETHDGVAPLSEQFLIGLRDDRLGHRHLLAIEDGEVLGVAALDRQTVELFVGVDHRGRGIGQALVDALPASPQIWAHGNLPAAQALAKRNEMDVVRRLLVMAIEGRDLRAAEEAPATVDGLEIHTYTKSVERFGREHVEAEWVRTNNEAFSWHPEQGGWDLERLHRGMEAEWFDPADVLFLWDSHDGAHSAPTMAGFHWLKWHAEDTPAFGEVYVVGLGEDYRGRGLGGPLLTAGLQRMVEKRADKVILYVEADNDPAVKAYERLGFSIAEEHCVWAKSD